MKNPDELADPSVKPSIWPRWPMSVLRRTESQITTRLTVALNGVAPKSSNGCALAVDKLRIPLGSGAAVLFH